MKAQKGLIPRRKEKTDQLKSDQIETRANPQNAQKVHSYPKGDLRHWSQRVRKLDSPLYSIQIAYRKHRHRFPLETSHKDAAARKALEIYQMLRSSGWESTLARFKPKTTPVTKGSTVGDLTKAVTELTNVRATTLRGYIATFRRIVADVEGIELQKGRFARTGQGRDKWLDAVGAVELASLTPDRIEAWKVGYIRKKAGHNQLKQRAAKNSANTMIRMGKSLFSKRLMRLLSNRLNLPSPLPFDGVDLFPRQSMRYTSTMDLPAVIKTASNELAQKDPEAFKAFVLALFGGLRRNEADKLRWSSVDFTNRVIRVERQPDFTPKAETSLSEVPMDSEAIEILKQLYREDVKTEYVLAGDSPKRKFKLPRLATQSSGKLNWAKYRASETFNRLTEWLREHGVNTRTPLHTLRKEAGSLVAASHGIFEASRFLRHADVAITAQHYVATKRRVSTGIGSLLEQEKSNTSLLDQEAESVTTSNK